MTVSRFADRFGYARWLYHLRHGIPPKHTDIARAVDRTGPAVGAWVDAPEAPTDYRVHQPLAGFLEVEETWLIRGAGEAPRPELWEAWRKARNADSKIKEPPADTFGPGQRAPTSRTATPAKKRA